MEHSKRFSPKLSCLCFAIFIWEYQQMYISLIIIKVKKKKWISDFYFLEEKDIHK